MALRSEFRANAKRLHQSEAALGTSVRTCGFFLIAAVLGGCADRLAPPRIAPLPEESQSSAYGGYTFVIRDFHVRDRLERRYEDDEDVARLRWAFAEAIRARFPEILVHGKASPKYIERANNVIFLDVLVVSDENWLRTIVFDIISLGYFGVFTPIWGDVELKSRVALYDKHDRLLGEVAATTERDYGAAFFTWFRTAHIEEAYQRAYHALFWHVGDQLATHDQFVQAVASLEKPMPPEEPSEPLSPELRDIRKALVKREAKATEARPSVALDQHYDKALGTPMLDEERAVRDRGPWIVLDPPRPGLSGQWRYLSYLGGLEVAAFGGSALVASKAADEFGEQVDIAEGRATQTGYRISTYTPPKTTGWSVYPALGYLSQKISIEDFREAIPTSDVSGAQEIAGTCSETLGGEEVSCDFPNRYDLELQSFYGGVRVGGDLVFGGERFQGFLSATGGVNLVEHRTLTARISSERDTRKGWVFAKSFALGMSAGVVFVPARMFLRFAVDREFYRQFRYERPLEFKGPVEYNEQKMIYERVQTLVKGARYESWNAQGAVGVYF